jgi:integrase
MTAKRTPSYRLHKPSGRAFVEIDGKRHYLGKHELPETVQAYHRLIAEWIAGGYRLPVPKEEITVLEVADAYSTYAEGCYVGRSGKLSEENSRIKLALTPVVALYGDIPAVQFGPIALRTVRQVWIDRNISISTINGYASTIKRMFKWATSHEMLPVEVHQALATLPGLRRGRGQGKDLQPRQIVLLENVEATVKRLPSTLRAVIYLLLYTAARPTELLRLKRSDIDTNGDVWTAIIREHKTMDKGKQRRLFFGPRAQAVLRPFLLRPDDDYMFSPKEAEAERHAKCKAHRRPNQKPAPKKTSRVVRCFYDHDGLNRAIDRVCKKYDIPKWTPYQLRHLAATTIEATADLETASAILGHSGLNITQVYVHRDNKTAAAWAATHG